MELQGERKPSSNVKRRMKTPTQREVLEKTYMENNYPSEAVRAELSVQLGLSDRQLQMWFCHRRNKDKVQKKDKEKAVASGAPAPSVVMTTPANYYDDYDCRKQRPSKPNSEEERVTAWKKRPPILQNLSPAELRAVAAVEAQLGEPLRDDGPILGVEFDPLPPGAFESPIAPLSEQYKQGGHQYENLFDEQDARSNKVSSQAPIVRLLTPGF